MGNDPRREKYFQIIPFLTVGTYEYPVEFNKLYTYGLGSIITYKGYLYKSLY